MREYAFAQLGPLLKIVYKGAVKASVPSRQHALGPQDRHEFA